MGWQHFPRISVTYCAGSNQALFRKTDKSNNILNELLKKIERKKIMISTIFIIGMAIFVTSSIYFWFTKKKVKGMNTAFLVSFVTLASYTLMWQGSFVAENISGQPIY